MAEGGFGGHTPRCTAELCLNQRHRGAGCTRCVDVCPTAAIGLGGHRPSLDPDLCVQCGACVVACPTDVFAQISPPEQALSLTFQHLPPSVPLELVCPLRSVGSETHAPVAAIVRHQRCLASLSIPHLLDLSGQGTRPLWLDDSPCGDCAFGSCHSLLLASVAGANELLAGLSRSPSLALHTTQLESLLDEPQPLPVLDGMKAQLSRRGFFGALRQMGQKRVDRALEEEAPPMLQPAVAVNERLPRHLPHSRQELLVRLAALTADDTPADESLLSLHSLPFAAVTVDASACSACGLCTRFCPTGALHFDGPDVGLLRAGNETAYSLDFQARLCIDCAICQVACPEDAITFDDSLPVERVLSSQAEQLAAGTLTACISCGVAVADHWQPPRCSICRHGAGTVAPLGDDVGLLADLVRRSAKKG